MHITAQPPSPSPSVESVSSGTLNRLYYTIVLEAYHAVVLSDYKSVHRVGLATVVTIHD